jgi:hypothetical protein
LMHVAERRRWLRCEGEPLGFVIPREPLALAERLGSLFSKEDARKAALELFRLGRGQKRAAGGQPR